MSFLWMDLDIIQQHLIAVVYSLQLKVKSGEFRKDRRDSDYNLQRSPDYDRSEMVRGRPSLCCPSLP